MSDATKYGRSSAVVRGKRCGRGHDAWVQQPNGKGHRCHTCNLAGQVERDAGRTRTPRQAIHPRVRRAINTTSGGRATKAGYRKGRWSAGKDAVPRDRNALIEQWNLQGGICAVSGRVMLTDAKDHRSPFYAEPDRIIPEFGYVAGNVRWIEKQFNHAKSNIPLQTLVLLGRYAERELLASPLENT